MKKHPEHIIIIGATSGLGQRLAVEYISRGCRVGIAGRRTDALEALAAEWPRAHVATMQIDVTRPDAPERLLALIEKIGGADLIINAAGIGYMNPQLDLDKDLRTVATNCDGFVRVADTAFRYLADNGGGQLVNISSVAATKGLAWGASYSASKRFQANYMQALDQLRRMQKLPVRLTDIRPGFIATDLLDPARRYPMLMPPDRAVRQIVRAIDRRRRVAVINRRWSILAFFWRLIPDRLWTRLPVKISL